MDGWGVGVLFLGFGVVKLRLGGIVLFFRVNVILIRFERFEVFLLCFRFVFICFN